MRQSQLPQGSSSSNWQPSYHPWEQNLQPHWEPYPATAVAWPDEWAPSNPQVEEQAQLLWALSDRAVPKYRKPPPVQPEQSAPTRIRTEREVKFALPPDESSNPKSSPVRAKPKATLPRKETTSDAEEGSRGGTTDEHQPPARPGAHPKKCPVQQDLVQLPARALACQRRQV